MVKGQFKAGDVTTDIRNGWTVRIVSGPTWDEQREEWAYRVVYQTGPHAEGNVSVKGVLEGWLQPLAESLLRTLIRSNHVN